MAVLDTNGLWAPLFGRILDMSRSHSLSPRSQRSARIALGLAIASSLLWSGSASAQLRTGRQTEREYYAVPSSSENPSLVAAREATPEEHSPASNPPNRPVARVASKRTAASPTTRPATVSNRIARASFVEALEAPEDAAPSNAPSQLVIASSAAASKAPVRLQPKSVARSEVRTAKPTASAHPSRTVEYSSKLSVEPVQLAGCPNCHPGQPHAAHAHAADERIVLEGDDSGVILDGGISNGVLEAGEAIGVESDWGHIGCGKCGALLGGCDCGTVPSLNIQISLPHLRHLRRLSARVEAATFWQTNQNIPAMVRTGAIGTAGSRDLFGGTNNMDETVQGWRGEIGWTFGQNDCNMLQLRFFDPSSQSLVFDSNKSNATSIVRPYLDPTNNTQQSISVLEPGISTGSSLSQASSSVYGGDLLLKRIVRRNLAGHTELLAGYQTAKLADDILVDTRTASIPSLNILQLRDQFSTTNRFNGATLGISRTTYGQSWSLSGMFKLGLGDLDRTVTISGFQSITVPSNPPTTNTSTNGLLARSTNNGVYNSNTFVVSSEVNVTFGYRLTKNLDATFGYSYLGLPKVLRAADQIDPQMASNLSDPLTGPARPAFTQKEDNFSLNTISYGLQYRY